MKVIQSAAHKVVVALGFHVLRDRRFAELTQVHHRRLLELSNTPKHKPGSSGISSKTARLRAEDRACARPPTLRGTQGRGRTDRGRGRARTLRWGPGYGAFLRETL